MKKVQHLSEKLLTHHLVQLVASDAHERAFSKKAYYLLENTRRIAYSYRECTDLIS